MGNNKETADLREKAFEALTNRLGSTSDWIEVVTLTDALAAIEAAVDRERADSEYLKQAANSFNADLVKAQAEVERLRADLATAQRNLNKCIEDNAAWLLRDVERSKVARTDLVAAEQRGREIERGDLAEHLEAVAQSLSLRGEQERYREIAALIRARGEKTESILPGDALAPR